MEKWYFVVKNDNIIVTKICQNYPRNALKVSNNMKILTIWEDTESLSKNPQVAKGEFLLFFYYFLSLKIANLTINRHRPGYVSV